MIADYNTMPEMFWECNRLYFDHQLPTPRYGILHSFSILGRFEWLRGWQGKPPTRMTILMSDYFDFPEDIFKNIMAHEMIHFYLLLNGKDNKASHGSDFKAMAQALNQKYGLNITTTYDASEIPNSPNAHKRTWWRNLFL